MFLKWTAIVSMFVSGVAFATDSKTEVKPEQATEAAQEKSNCCVAYTKEALEDAWSKRHTQKQQLVETVSKRATIPEDYEIAWRISRMAFFVGFYLLPKDGANDKKMEVHQYGIDAATIARKLGKDRVEGHYYYSVNQGGHGLAKGILASLKAAEPMRQALDEAVRIDPSFDFGGPYRVRGRLYFQLPGGFLSFGDNKKSIEDLKKAVAAFPNHRLNLVYLSEVQNKVEGKDVAIKTLDLAKAVPDGLGPEEDEGSHRDLAKAEKKIK